ncbi:MAG: tRNA lysidine(34) synthetase TilS [Zetaproteobacteria bacterium CG_4_9_14_3_um_filter_53_7]|nr:MAG: tRNA lysidine(34) synthetase TilS [Zetaproteobacteria bacterium CG_4_9_14_3_um_filter_53_7]
MPELQGELFSGWLEGQSVVPLSQPVAVGWSGGADSTALLLALKAAGYQVQAWHVDHAWRASSQVETEVLAIRAETWGIPFYASRLNVPSGKNIEAEARAGRYAQFVRWGKKLAVDTLCLGHHREDQAETVYMRLLQGAGAGGCRGMHGERMFEGLRLLRPLLHVPGAELKQTLRQSGVGWFDDPSNDEAGLWRNRIRRRSFPAMVRSGCDPVALFLRWKVQADRVAAALDEGAGKLLGYEGVDSGGGVSLCWSDWCSSSAAVRARALQKMMVCVLGEGITPGRRHIEAVELWTSKKGRGGIDLSRCRLYRVKDKLHLKPVSHAFTC